MTSDLTWLPLSLRKNIDLPKIVYLPYVEGYGGYYSNCTLHIVENIQYECNNGSVIAHEFMHHLQFTRGKSFNHIGLQGFTKYSYNKAIREYFRKSSTEMEALLFQHKVAPVETTKFWLKGLVLSNKFDENLQM